MSRTEGDMCQQLPRVETRWRQASENRAYVRRLLREREPVFLALLEDAEHRIDNELASRRSAEGTRIKNQ